MKLPFFRKSEGQLVVNGEIIHPSDPRYSQYKNAVSGGSANPRAAAVTSGGAAVPPVGDPFSSEASIVGAPAEVAVTEGRAPVVAESPANAEPSVAQVQAPPAERPLSYTGSMHNGHQLIVLYRMDKNAPPVPVEAVIDSWCNLPDALRFNIAEVSHAVYCMDVVNGTPTVLDTIPPDGISRDVLAEHDRKVAAYLSKLTGEPPAAPSEKSLKDRLKAELLSSLKDASDEDLIAFWDEVCAEFAAEDVRRILVNPGHRVLGKKRASEDPEGGSGRHERRSQDGQRRQRTGSQPQSADPPQPRPQPTQTSTGSSRKKFAKL